jgi:hypothetical protein
VLKFSTARDQGLGDALPAGTVRVYHATRAATPSSSART